MHQCLGDVQELQFALETSHVRAGSGKAMTKHGDIAQPLPPSLAQFAEAQRIIILDAVRTDFSQSGQRSAASFGNSGSAIRGEAQETAHILSRYNPAAPCQLSSFCRRPSPGLRTQHNTLTVAHQQCGLRKKSWLSATVVSSYRDYSVATTITQAVRALSLQAGPSSGGAREDEGLHLGRVAEETLAGATHLSAFERHAAGRLIHLLSAYAMHDPETGYCQVCILPHSFFGGLVNSGTD